jgi:putative transcription factor
MCGAETSLMRASIEGTELSVCKRCARYGKVIRKEQPPARRFAPQRPQEKENTEMVVSNYSNLIKDARERMGLKQEELAKQLAEKVSLIHQMESSKFKPPLALAKKLQRFLRVKLVEEYEEERGFSKGQKGESLTLGDLIKVRKR